MNLGPEKNSSRMEKTDVGARITPSCSGSVLLQEGRECRPSLVASTYFIRDRRADKTPPGGDNQHRPTLPTDQPNDRLFPVEAVEEGEKGDRTLIRGSIGN